MNEKVALCVAIGCATAFSATNYDLLGRNGSKMNSPMVYRNLDYSKMKKDNQQDAGAQRSGKSLKKLSTALTGVEALEGAFSTKGLKTCENGNTCSFYLKKYYPNGYEGYGYYRTLNNGSSSYLGQANNYFIPTNVVQNYTPSGMVINNGNPNNAPASNVYGFDLTEQYYSYSSPTHFSAVEYNLAKKNEVEWWLYNSGYSQCQECGDVGIYMDADAFPVRLDPSKVVKYLVYDANDHIFPNHQKEMLASKTYSILQATTTENTRVFVGNSLPQNPASKTPQVYMSIHNRPNDSYTPEEATFYGPEARDLDNYIYENRTIDIVAVGNYWVRNNRGQLNPQAHAVNAVTVGAVNANDQKIPNYTSFSSHYCNKGMGHCLGSESYYSVYGTAKPEIYNYTDFYMQGDRKRTYTNWFTHEPFPYDPYYTGTESAASYTAGMVAGLLRANPFYRWHPEVVKAVLLNAGDNNIATPYPHGEENVATKKVPTYRSTVFNRFHSSQFHESRYWIGDWDRLFTHDRGYRGEIRFSVQRPTDKHNFSATIAWLTSGNDIAKLGVIPQNFELLAYESNSSNVDAIDNNLDNYKAQSLSGSNSFSRISFSSNAPYLTFRIVFLSDYDRSENYNQVVLGFDVASTN